MYLRQAEGVLEPAETAVALGHSVGQFAALVAAGSLQLADAVRLVVRSTMAAHSWCRLWLLCHCTS